MQGRFAIKGKWLFGASEEGLIEDAVVLVEGQRIRDFGKLDKTRVPKQATHIDLGNCTVMPGLIDSHVHVSMGGEDDFILLELRELTSYRTLKALAHATKALQAGFTTLRTAGEKGYADIALKRAVGEGIITGPRIVTSGKVLCVTGGHRDGYFTPEVRYDGSSIVVNGVDAVVATVREQSKMGVDWVKLIVTGGFDTPTDPETQHMSDREIAAGIREAKRLGKRTCAHAHGRESIKTIARAGINSVEHGTFLDEEGAYLMMKNNVFLSPTLLSSYSFMERQSGAGDGFTVAKKKFDSHAEGFRTALEAGVKIVASSDAGGPRCYHGENYRELEIMVEAGMTPGKALQCGTKVAAEMLGMQHELGTIERGKLADIIAVEGNPLDDIKKLRKVRLVMKEGQIVRVEKPS